MRNPNPDSPGVNVSVRGANGKAPWMATASSPNSMSAPSWAAIIKAFVQSSHSEGRRIMVRPSAIMATATIRCITLLLGCPNGVTRQFARKHTQDHACGLRPV